MKLSGPAGFQRPDHPVPSAPTLDSGRSSPPGTFELVRADGGVLIRLLDGAGALLAFSGTYADIAAAVEGIETMRECAATSHISDRTAPAPEPAGRTAAP
ncbi:YegP family protein [Arthrobacter sp. CG_A4]|uniref:YegP family protein n=1 Tax=Arthrobacter sp. CG_A4 TaxID=3071706 RepID=UPI002DFD50AC|nr:hypothetical protein [Arthrobacter sp. CG_A4]